MSFSLAVVDDARSYSESTMYYSNSSVLNISGIVESTALDEVTTPNGTLTDQTDMINKCRSRKRARNEQDWKKNVSK